MIHYKDKQNLIYANVLLEPCYYALKKNAGLLKDHERKHLENLLFLLKNKKEDFFLSDFYIFKNTQFQKDSPLAKMRKQLIDMIKRKIDSIERLKTENIVIDKELRNKGQVIANFEN